MSGRHAGFLTKSVGGTEFFRSRFNLKADFDVDQQEPEVFDYLLDRTDSGDFMPEVKIPVRCDPSDLINRGRYVNDVAERFFNITSYSPSFPTLYNRMGKTQHGPNAFCKLLPKVWLNCDNINAFFTISQDIAHHNGLKALSFDTYFVQRLMGDPDN